MNKISTGRIFYHMSTGSLGTRKREFGPKDYPFIHLNRADLEAAVGGPCCFCGYSGTAPRTLLVEAGVKSPAQLVQSSRAGFLRAMAAAKVACPTCACEQRGPTRRARRISKHPVVAVNRDPSVVLSALRSDILDTDKTDLSSSDKQTELSSDAHLTSVFSGSIQQSLQVQEHLMHQNPGA